MEQKHLKNFLKKESKLMKINPIRITNADNKHIKYLINQVMEITNKAKVQCLYTNDYIEYSAPTKDVIKMLNELDIKFKEINNDNRNTSN